MLAFVGALALLFPQALATHAYYVYDTDEGAATAFEAMSITQVRALAALPTARETPGAAA
jgi:hypothetical protein